MLNFPIFVRKGAILGSDLDLVALNDNGFILIHRSINFGVGFNIWFWFVIKVLVFIFESLRFVNRLREIFPFVGCSFINAMTFECNICNTSTYRVN